MNDVLKFRLMLQSCGLSKRAASEYLCKPISKIEAMLEEKTPVTDYEFDNLLALSNYIDRMSFETLVMIEDMYVIHGQIPEDFALLYVDTDEEAKQCGYPSLAVYNSILRRVFEQLDIESIHQVQFEFNQEKTAQVFKVKPI